MYFQKNLGMKFIFILFFIVSCSHVKKENSETFKLIQEIENTLEVRVGVFAFQTTGKNISYRENERFLMCSTFKLLLCAQLLDRVAKEKESLEEFVRISNKDIIQWSPVTKKHVGKKMSLGALCKATIQMSDNTAANKLLKKMEGPKALTSYLREQGDLITRLDRYEPSLNVLNGEMDTTTPSSMTNTIKKVYSKRLDNWLRGAKTGKTRLKSGLPTNWAFAHKTGTCEGGPSNDVGIIYPVSGEPIYVSVFVEGENASFKQREKAHQSIARLITKYYSK